LPVAVRVGDQDLGRAGFARRFDAGVDLRGHEAAEALILEAARANLLVCYDTDHALHVRGYKNLERVCGIRLRRRRLDNRLFIARRLLLGGRLVLRQGTGSGQRESDCAEDTSELHSATPCRVLLTTGSTSRLGYSAE